MSITGGIGIVEGLAVVAGLGLVALAIGLGGALLDAVEQEIAALFGGGVDDVHAPQSISVAEQDHA